MAACDHWLKAICPRGLRREVAKLPSQIAIRVDCQSRGSVCAVVTAGQRSPQQWHEPEHQRSRRWRIDRRIDQDGGAAASKIKGLPDLSVYRTSPPFCSVPELFPAISTVLPSPVHQPTNPGGAAAHDGWITTRGVLPVTDSALAVMVALPAATARASPEPVTVATVATEEDQLTKLVVSSVFPSLVTQYRSETVYMRPQARRCYRE